MHADQHLVNTCHVLAVKWPLEMQTHLVSKRLQKMALSFTGNVRSVLRRHALIRSVYVCISAYSTAVQCEHTQNINTLPMAQHGAVHVYSVTVIFDRCDDDYLNNNTYVHTVGKLALRASVWECVRWHSNTLLHMPSAFCTRPQSFDRHETADAKHFVLYMHA